MGQRLGLAAALLGDPGTLILDEPANGLDPQGVHWLRGMLKALAGQGRSVLVSSHLLSEMALMADELVVIGRGRLIAQGPVQDFISHASGSAVVVRSPETGKLADLLKGRDDVSVSGGDGELRIVGLAAAAIGDLAFDHQVRLHELASQTATLEEAFLEATSDDQEFAAKEDLS